MENPVNATRPFNAHPPIARANDGQSKSRSRVFRTTPRRIVEYFFRSKPRRIDGLTPHLQRDIGLTDFYLPKRGVPSTTSEDFFPYC